MSDSDDDVPQLSTATLAALQEFYAESGRTGLEQESIQTDKFCVGAVEEDWVGTVNVVEVTYVMICWLLYFKLYIFVWLYAWSAYWARVCEQRMSQFWYSEDTATRLAEEVMQQAGEHGRLVSSSFGQTFTFVQLACIKTQGK